MATRSSNSLFPDNSTDVNFRGWVQFIEDTLVTTGTWVVTSDTGQMTIATASHPTTSNQSVGYRVYRMSDALQATSPVFLKIEYGSSSNSTNTPGTWITIGTGSDGAGAITGIRLARLTIRGSGTSSSLANNCYGSATPGRLQLAMFIQSSSYSYSFILSLERTKDSLGNDTDSGLLVLWHSPFDSSVLKDTQYVNLGSVSQPPREGGVTYVLANQNPSVFNNDIGIGVAILFKGAAVQPGTGMAFVRGNDFANESTFSVSLYGASRTFQHLSNQIFPAVPSASSQSTDSTARCCMLFD